MKVALFVTCVNDAFYPATGRAVVSVLERLGHQVVFPTAQTCCGQMHLNTGYRPEALALARHFVRTFSSYQAIVCPSASCVGTVRESYVQAAEDGGDAELATEARSIAGRVHELSSFLVDVLGVEDVGASFPHRVAYHPTCHSLRSLRVRSQPLALLSKVQGLRLVEFADATTCCGFGGTFAIKNAATSASMLADKLAALRSAGVEVVCALDNSCLAHIGGGSSRSGLGIRAMHLAEILATTGSDTTCASLGAAGLEKDPHGC